MTLIQRPFAKVYRPLLAKRRSQKMQIEHVTNSETVIGTNYWKSEKIGMKSQKNKKRCKNALKNKNASGGITTRTYSPICTYSYKIHQYFLQSITNAIQPLAQRLCTNCRELSNFYTQIFMFFLRTSSESLQQSFFPLLCFHFHWKKFSVPSLNKNILICKNIILKAVL